MKSGLEYGMHPHRFTLLVKLAPWKSLKQLFKLELKLVSYNNYYVAGMLARK